MWNRDRATTIFEVFNMKLDGFLNKLQNFFPRLSRGNTTWEVGHVRRPGPSWRKCTAYCQTGPGGPPLGLGLNEGWAAFVVSRRDEQGL